MDPRLDEYLTLLFKWNRRFSLTAFSDAREAWENGITPSFLAARHLPQGARVLDVGSGGGFPAVPLAVVRPDLRFVLTEPSHPKAVFLMEAARALGLAYRVETRTVEALVSSEPGPWDAVTARGVHLRKGLLRKLVKVLAPGGALLIWAAGTRAEEYRAWMADAGLHVESGAANAGEITFLAGHVPRGTMG